MNRNLFRILFTFVVLIPLQVLVFRNFVLFGSGFCFIYLLVLIALPVELSVMTGMIVALLSGLVVDIFYHTLGIHASAAVLFMFLRYHWLNLNGPRSGYEVNHLPVVRNYGLSWFIGYTLPLIFIYCLTVFMIEAGTLDLIWQSLLKSFITTFLSLIFIIFVQFFVFPKQQ